jgi:hypothetical protein
MQFQQDDQQYKLQGITTGSPEIISSHRMEKILKKGHLGIISQLNSIKAIETPSMHPDLQYTLQTPEYFFHSPWNSPFPRCS